MIDSPVLIHSRVLLELPAGERTRCHLCGRRGHLRVYQIGPSRSIYVLHWECAAQLLAEVSRLLEAASVSARIPGQDACSS